MTLNEILKSCVNKKIDSFYSSGHKLFPFDGANLYLKEHTVGFYCVMNNNESIFMFRVRGNHDFNIYSYSITYSRNNEIIEINIDNNRYKMNFKL